MDYFRAIIKSGEISMRVYEITGLVVKELANNYTAWYIRQECIEKLHINLKKELQFVNHLFHCDQKTFQLWYYLIAFCLLIKKGP